MLFVVDAGKTQQAPGLGLRQDADLSAPPRGLEERARVELSADCRVQGDARRSLELGGDDNALGDALRRRPRGLRVDAATARRKLATQLSLPVGKIRAAGAQAGPAAFDCNTDSMRSIRPRSSSGSTWRARSSSLRSRSETR